MTHATAAFLAQAGAVDARQRAMFAETIRRGPARGVLVIETCHRVEVYGSSEDIAALAPVAPVGAAHVGAQEAARHLVRLAIGLESAVIAEDQVLHQLRAAATVARHRGNLPPELDRLVDSALSAGRRARSWFPAQRSSLVEIALARVTSTELRDRRVLIVGAGKMGSLAVAALRRSEARIFISSRTAERARALAARWHVPATSFDPGAEFISAVDGVIVALAGAWQLSPETTTALVDGDGWVVDLSAPPAVASETALRLGTRMVAVDDLSTDADRADVSPAMLRRLETLVDVTLDDYWAWVARHDQRDVANALGDKAEQARAAELADLWRRMPALDAQARAEVERMAVHLTERLLRDPLEALNEDNDGRHAAAAREFFRL